MSEVKYSRQEEPLVISKSTIDLLLKQTHPADAIALYNFYYYTAKWQGTNQPKATTNYVAKGLKWPEDRVRRTKKVLSEIGLIEDVVNRDKSNKIIGHYILVKFIWSQETIKNHPMENPDYGFSHTMESPKTNALSTNSINALSTNNKYSFLNKNLRKNNSTSDEVLVSDILDSSYKDNNIPLQNNPLSDQGNLGSLPSQDNKTSLLKENTPLPEKETLDTLPGEGRLLKRTKVQRLRNVSVPVPTKPKLSFTVPKVIQPIIDHWGSCGLKQNRPNTKVCKQTCHAIAQLRQGAFFNNKLTFEKYRNYKFTDEEIKKAIDHFAMAATLDDYSPEAGEYKNRLAKMDLYTFLYNAYNNTGNKSLFIQYLQYPPKLVSSTAALVKDLDPDATAFYRRWWSRLLDEQQLIMNKEITPADENNFRRATASTLKFIEKYRNKFNISAYGMWPSLPPGTIAVFVCEAIEADIWDRGGDFSPVTTGWLCTATTWTKRVPNYFLNQDLIRDRSLTNIYEVREKEEEEEDIRQYLDPREIMEEEAST